VGQSNLGAGANMTFDGFLQFDKERRELMEELMAGN
jgi:hypothetical protein